MSARWASRVLWLAGNHLIYCHHFYHKARRSTYNDISLPSTIYGIADHPDEHSGLHSTVRGPPDRVLRMAAELGIAKNAPDEKPLLFDHLTGYARIARNIGRKLWSILLGAKGLLHWWCFRGNLMAADFPDAIRLRNVCYWILETLVL